MRLSFLAGFAASLLAVAFAPSGFAEEKKEAKADSKDAQAQPLVDDETKRRWAETVKKLEEMDKQWQAQGGKAKAEAKRVAQKRDDEKSEADQKSAGADKKSGKQKDSSSDDSPRTANSDSSGASRRVVSYNGHAVPEGAWLEVGGVANSSRFSGSSGPSSVRESSSTSSSISVRTTVIRFEDND